MEYTHIPGSTAQVILLFHGTGGSSAELLGLGQYLNKDATLIGIDGEVFENGMRRYFERYSNGSFNLESLKANTDKVYEKIKLILKKENLEDATISALGYSNGANLLLNLMREYDDNAFDNLLLFHPSPAREDDPFIQKDVEVFMTSGKQDPFITKDEFKQLQKALKKADNTVKTFTHDLGHQLIHEELEEAKRFLEKI
ncbi:MAG TPA: dienelactone hydrolase family protein [Erysipelothrix sp.]|nr:dienelactone hydrolase family protein [Erysipelothrix sp.]